jgi:histidyl-tRNA synthetase
LPAVPETDPAAAPDTGPVPGPFHAPKGTHDVLPPESARWTALLATFAGIVERAGYGLLQGPVFEEIGVFRRMGEGTDVVRKEMYDFFDKGGRHVALRPEGTAGAVRAFIEHHPAVLPWKVWYAAPNFRYEAPQSGRLRQHHQVGVEAIGVADPDLDVEVISLLADVYTALGLRQVRLVLNSIGTPDDRRGYINALRSYLVTHIDELAPDDREKVEAHPMRVLDTKREQSLGVVAGAPLLIDALSPDALAHFERVQAGLAALDLAFEIEPRLVRGLDYYTHTAFEFRSDALDAAQNTIGGGGRYDGLVESLGGKPMPGIGFGSGIERVLLTCDAEGVFPGPPTAVEVFVVDTAGGDAARDLSAELRRAGVRVDRAWDGRSMKAQMKAADRSGARLVCIVGTDEAEAGTVVVRDLRGDTGQAVHPRHAVVTHLAELLGPS